MDGAPFARQHSDNRSDREETDAERLVGRLRPDHAGDETARRRPEDQCQLGNCIAAAHDRSAITRIAGLHERSDVPNAVDRIASARD